MVGDREHKHDPCVYANRLTGGDSIYDHAEYPQRADDDLGLAGDVLVSRRPQRHYSDKTLVSALGVCPRVEQNDLIAITVPLPREACVHTGKRLARAISHEPHWERCERHF